MMRAFAFAIVLIASNATLHAQSDDSYSTAWLSKHLNYSYFNFDQQKWWVNKFEYNNEGIAHFQNLSTENPKKFSGRSWIDRRVRWVDLDPYSITINQVAENQGRIVKGSVLHIDVINHQRKIRKSLDGKPATPENFLQIAIPRSITDTSTYFVDSLKYHLVAAIEWNSRISSAGVDEDIRQIFRTLRGTFSSTSITRTYTQVFPNQLQYTDKLGAKPIRTGFFGYDNEDGLFESILDETGSQVHYYELLEKDGVLTLEEKNGGDRRLSMPSLLHFQLDANGNSTEFKRVSYR